MTKSELINRLAMEHPHLNRADVERVVIIIFDEMKAALVRGGRIELRRFGSFSVRVLRARPGRNPKTGETVLVKARAHPAFKSGKEPQARLNAAPRGG